MKEEKRSWMFLFPAQRKIRLGEVCAMAGSFARGSKFLQFPIRQDLVGWIIFIHFETGPVNGKKF